MSITILRQMCQEMIAELEDCVRVIDEEETINRDWSDKISNAYRILCD